MSMPSHFQMAETHIQHHFHVSLVGDSEVGKSSIANTDEFVEEYEPTRHMEWMSKTIELAANKIELTISDTTGNKRLRGVLYTYYREANAIIIIFDITKYVTFTHVQDWLDVLQKTAKKNPIIMLVGTNSDLAENRKVSIEEAQAFADKVDIPYWETSAKSGYNINAMFEDLAKRLFAAKQYDFMNRYQNNDKYVNVSMAMIHEIINASKLECNDELSKY